jgi:hypothetical protein
MADYVPSRQAEYRDWVDDFVAKLVASPTTYGFVASDLTPLSAALSAFDSAFDLAVDPATRTRGVVNDKEVKRASLTALIRSFARRIQANPAVTDQQKIDLGLPIHDADPSAGGEPTTRPVMSVVGAVNNDVVVRIVDELTPTRRGKPAGTIGAYFYSHVGPTPAPSDPEQLSFEGMATRGEFTISFNPEDAGKTITLLACWVGPTGKSGPMGAPVMTIIAPAGGSGEAQAA